MQKAASDVHFFVETKQDYPITFYSLCIAGSPGIAKNNVQLYF